MYTPIYAPWENVPKKLTHREIMKPSLVVKDFFAIDFVDGHWDKLKKWRHYVTRTKCYQDKRDGTGKLLYIYDANIRLLEAVCLKYYEVINKGLNEIKYNDIQVENEKAGLDWYPDNLRLKELRNPYRAVGKIFKRICLQQYRDYLHEWLYCALCTKSCDEDLDDKEIKMVYKNMQKLYSAAWLIYNRETMAGKEP